MKYNISKKYSIIITGIICIVIIFFMLQTAWAALSDLNPLHFDPANPKGYWPTLGGYVVSAMLGISGSFALFMIVYGGFYMLTSAGDEKKFTKGKIALTWAIIGLIVIMASYALVSLVLSTLPSTT